MVRIDLGDLSTSYGLRDAYLGEKPMSAIIVGTRSVTRDQIYNLDGERSTPKGGVVTVPSWATSFGYVVSGAGKGGLDGNGGFAAYGNGGRGGEVKVGWMLVQPENRSISYSLGASYNRGRVGGSSSISYGGQSIISEGGSETNGGQGGTALTVDETDSSLGQSADDWLTRLKVSRNNDDGTKYRPGGYGTGNAGAGTRGGGGAGGNGGIFGNFTHGGWGGPGYIRIVFWGLDRTLHDRSQDKPYKQPEMVFSYELTYNSTGREGVFLPRDDHGSLEGYRIRTHSENFTYLDDYTFRVRKSGFYAFEAHSYEVETGEYKLVREILLEITPEGGGPTRRFSNRDAMYAHRDTRLNVGDTVQYSVVNNNNELSRLEVFMVHISD